LTRAELAKDLGISLRTLTNWEKEKPKLVKLINLGLQVENQIVETKKHLEKLVDLEKEAEKGKFIL